MKINEILKYENALDLIISSYCLYRLNDFVFIDNKNGLLHESKDLKIEFKKIYGYSYILIINTKNVIMK